MVVLTLLSPSTSGNVRRSYPSPITLVLSRLVPYSLQLQFLTTDPVCLIPVDFGLAYRTIGKPNRRKPLRLPLPSRSVDFPQPASLTNRVADRDRFRVDDFSGKLKLQQNPSVPTSSWDRAGRESAASISERCPKVSPRPKAPESLTDGCLSAAQRQYAFYPRTLMPKKRAMRPPSTVRSGVLSISSRVTS